MKKLLLTLLLTALTLPVFAIDFSVGAGGLGGGTFTRYKMSGPNSAGSEIVSTQNMDRIDFGGFVFFDITYAELGVLFQAGKNRYNEVMTIEGETLMDGSGKGSEMSIAISLIGKWPFEVTEKLTMYPMFGGIYHIVLKQQRQPEGSSIVYNRTSGMLPEDNDENGNSYPLNAWNAGWINVGGGADIFLTNSIFLRTQVLLGFRLPTKYEMGALGFVQKTFDLASRPKLSGITVNPTLKLGLGYRF